MLCLNCGKREAMDGNLMCKECDDSGKSMIEELKKGITLEYEDGTTETLKINESTDRR